MKQRGVLSLYFLQKNIIPRTPLISLHGCGTRYEFYGYEIYGSGCYGQMRWLFLISTTETGSVNSGVLLPYSSATEDVEMACFVSHWFPGVFLYALYTGTAALGSLVLLNKLKQLQPYHEEAMKAQEKKDEIAKRFGRPPIDTNRYEDVIACDVINPDHIDVDFDCIGGLKGIKQSLFELVILPLRRPELFSCGKLLGPQKGVLLYGPPGTGKTMLAKAIAAKSRAVFINVKISNLLSKWFGEAEKLVAAVFSLANKLQPAIIFIDEVDSFLGQRRETENGALTSMKTEFMALWDGLTTDQNARVMVLAATNRPSELDEAILRRFSQSFEVGLPDCKEREEILKVILRGQKVEHDIDYAHIATLCERYSGSDLLNVCKKAAYLPIREFLDDEKSRKSSHLTDPRPVRQSDIEKVLATSKKTSTAAQDYTKRRDGGDEYPVHSEKVLATLKKRLMAAQDYTEQRDGGDVYQVHTKKVLATSTKTSTAAQDCTEQRDGDDAYPVYSANNEPSKLGRRFFVFVFVFVFVFCFLFFIFFPSSIGVY